MRIIGVLVLLIAASVVAVGATQNSSSDRPPGVAPEQWVAVGDSLGVVLAPADHQAPRAVGVDKNSLLLVPPTQGYFMIKQGDVWRRLILGDPTKGPASAG